MVPSAKLAIQQFYNARPRNMRRRPPQMDAGRLRASNHGERFYAPLTGRTIHLTRTVVASCYKLLRAFILPSPFHPAKR
ncbi:hypothetical protein FIBSPDRAFT_853901 [Athelia psychrophila]|uniref:Uncharacterized protein n=1 Tax=Athelia psychrophila TaxID=1759441 RepID=A0A166QI54_9AGAM|nr:hypothetical protein FIBSPDRAFT_853901 [Fibularhizoctonia sp. CBS 109695]